MGASELLGEAVVWVTACVGLLTLAAWALRRGPAVVRHAAWRGALLLFWLIPAGVVAGGALHLGVLPAPAGPVYEAPAAAVPEAEAGPAASATAEPAASATTPAAPAAPAPAVPDRPLPAAAPGGSRAPLSPVTALLLLWAAGAVIALAAFGRDLRAVRRLCRTALPSDEPALTQLVAHWASRLGIATPPQVVRCPDVAAPTVVGWRRPRLLLPPSLRGDEAGCTAVLVHELAHVKGGHTRLQLLACVTRALWWWHPLAWVVLRQLQVSGEEVCDDWVVALTGEPEAYAQHLVQWAERGQLQGAVAYSACGHVLVRRVQRVLAQTRAPRVQMSRGARLALATGVAVLLSAAAVLRAAPARPVLRVTLRTTGASAAQVKATAQVLRSRVEAYGLPASVVRAGADGVITLAVQTSPHSSDLEANLAALLTAPGSLQIRAIARAYALGTAHSPYIESAVSTELGFTTASGARVPTATVLARSPVLMTGQDMLPTSRVTGGQGQETMVGIELRDSASKRVRAFTRSHVGTWIAFTLDGKLLTVAIVKGEMPSKGVLAGCFDGAAGLARAKQLSAMLNSGPLSVPVRWVGSRGGEVAATDTGGIGPGRRVVVAPPRPVLRVDLAVGSHKPVSVAGMDRVRWVLRDRVVAYGLPEPTLRQAANTISVELGGVEATPQDRSHLESLLTAPGRLEFRAIPRRYADLEKRVPEVERVGGREVTRFLDATGKELSTSRVLRASPVILSSADLGRESRVVDSIGPYRAVTFEVRPAARAKFAQFTSKHRNTYLAIVLDGRLLSCPVIRDTMRESGVIESAFDGPGGEEWARRFAALIRGGPLPLPVRRAQSSSSPARGR